MRFFRLSEWSKLLSNNKLPCVNTPFLNDDQHKEPGMMVGGWGGILLSCLSVGEYGRPLVWLGGPVFFQGWKEKCTCWSLVRRHLWSTLTDIKASTRGSRKWFKSVYTRTSYTRALLYSIQRVRQEDWSGYCVESFFQLAWVSGESKIEALL